MRELITDIDHRLDAISRRYKELMDMESKIYLAYRDLDFRRDELMNERERLTNKNHAA